MDRPTIPQLPHVFVSILKTKQLVTSLLNRRLESIWIEFCLTPRSYSSLHLLPPSFLWKDSAFLRWLFNTCRVSRMLVTSDTNSVWGGSLSSSRLVFLVLRCYNGKLKGQMTDVLVVSVLRFISAILVDNKILMLLAIA